MYCSQCGTQNSDTARFCYKCGKPISQPTSPYINPIIQKVMQEGTPEQIKHFRDTLNKLAHGSDESSTPQKVSLPTETLIISLRKIFVTAAHSYETKESERSETPFKMIKDDVLNALFAAEKSWKNLTTENIDILVKPYLFSEIEQKAVTNYPNVLLTYYDMIISFGNSLETFNLSTGALEMKMIMLLSELERLSKEKKWGDYDEWMENLLAQAHNTGSPHLLAIFLEKAANAKLMQKDKRACRTILDEFDKVAITALRKQPLYTTIRDDGNINILAMVKVAQNKAMSTRKAL